MSLLLDPSPTISTIGGGSPGSHTRCHAHVFHSFFIFFIIISTRLWPPALFSFPPGPFSMKDSLSLGGVLLTSAVSGRWNLFFVNPFSLTFLKTRSAFLFILCLLVSLPPDVEVSGSYSLGKDNPVGRDVVLAVTTEILPPARVLLMVGTSDCDSRSNTDVLLLGSSAAGRCAGRCVRWVGAPKGWSLLAGFPVFISLTGTTTVLATAAGKSRLPNWMVAPTFPVSMIAFASWILTPCPSCTVIGFNAIGEHTGASHNHNIVMPFGGESPGSEGPGTIKVYLTLACPLKSSNAKELAIHRKGKEEGGKKNRKKNKRRTRERAEFTLQSRASTGSCERGEGGAGFDVGLGFGTARTARAEGRRGRGGTLASGPGSHGREGSRELSASCGRANGEGEEVGPAGGGEVDVGLGVRARDKRGRESFGSSGIARQGRRSERLATSRLVEPNHKIKNEVNSRDVVLAVTTEILPPARVLLMVGTSDCDSRSNTDVLLLGSLAAGRCAGRCVRWVGAPKGWSLLAGFPVFISLTGTTTVLTTAAGKSRLPNWMVAPTFPVSMIAFASWILTPCPSCTVIGVFCSSICTNERRFLEFLEFLDFVGIFGCFWIFGDIVGLWEAFEKSAIIASGDSSADSESPPRFTCSICDAMSDSSSSGKYRSSFELQSIGFEELAWLRCCLEVDACTLGNPFRSSTGSGLVNDGIPWRILQSVDHHNRSRHESSFGPISEDLNCWGWISVKPHRMSRPGLFVFLFSHHLFEALASRLVFPSTGTFRQWSLNPWFKCHTPMFTVRDNRSFGGVLLASTISDLSPLQSSRLCKPELREFQALFSSKERLRLPNAAPRMTSLAPQDGWSFNGFKFRADGGGMDDGPDQDPMVPSSRAIVAPGFNAIGEHTGAGHNHNIVIPFGGKSPGSEGPGFWRFLEFQELLDFVGIFGCFWIFGDIVGLWEAFENDGRASAIVEFGRLREIGMASAKEKSGLGQCTAMEEIGRLRYRRQVNKDQEKRFLKLEICHLTLKADGGGMDDGPDQDPMVPSSRAIVVPGLLSQRSAIGEYTGAGHNHNIVVPFGSESPGSEGPES
ncbi:hypothetical protein M5K25_011139 [Dendrobium thyrsiflorum]|uniref:Uncharacterized protein n=1 Tax=Dendrobium thyrsiflorum TaxID=117978 RepID=A0ABD0V2K7_DENTH